MKKTGQSSPAPQAKTSDLAIASLIFAMLPIISWFMLHHDGYVRLPILVLIFLISIPLALVLGIVSIFKITKSKGQLKGKGLGITGIVIATLLLVLIIPGLTKIRSISPRMLCGTNMKALGNAIIVYACDNNDRYPTADKWCGLLLEGGYVTEKQFRCPRDEEGPCSYAMNPNAGLNSPPDMVLLFETKGGWNQFGGPELLTVDNHDGDGCNILFNDFLVKFVKTEQLGHLKWTAKEPKTPPKADADSIE